ncbi:MAG TPA: BTAD domain-containing putative transcriptional regulator [Kineosporiaceae bacterium]
MAQPGPTQGTAHDDCSDGPDEFPPGDAPIRVLGGVRVGYPGQELALGPPRQQALFALLLINAGTVVSVPGIVGALWGTSSPPGAVSTLQSYVSRLRRNLLADRSDRAVGRLLDLRHRTPGYVLTVEPRHIDAGRCEAAVERGRRLANEGNLAAAESTLDAALAGWQGTPYHGLEDYGFAQLESTRLEQLRLRTLQAWADTCLALGASEEVVWRLDAEIRRHPLQEKLAARLILAEYRSGRAAQALVTYEGIRAHLASELGVAPSRELQDLHRSILRQEDSTLLRPEVLSVPTAPARSASAPVVRVPGDGAPAETRPAGGGAGVPGEEPAPGPAPAPPWVGRDRELARLRALAAAGGRIALVVGEHGVGKSSLMSAADDHLRAEGRGSVWVHGADFRGAPATALWRSVARKLALARPAELAGVPAAARHVVGLCDGTSACGRADHGASAEPEPAAEVLREAVVDLLLRAASQPLTLVIDDLHQAPHGTVDLLRTIAREARGSGLFVMASLNTSILRPGSDRWPIVVDLLREGALECLEVRPMSVPDARRLAGQVWNRPVVWDEACQLHAATGGNPFLIRRLLAADPADADGVPTGLPFDVAVTLRSRLTACSPVTLEVLRVCAVVGTSAERRLITSVLAHGEGPDPVWQALDERLLVPQSEDAEQVRFAQGLLQHVVLADLEPWLRCELHHAVARALARGVVGPAMPHQERIGWHCKQAMDRLDPALAVEPLVGRADEAEADLRLDESRAWLSAAADLLAAASAGGDGRAAAPERKLRLRIERLTIRAGLTDSPPGLRQLPRTAARPPDARTYLPPFQVDTGRRQLSGRLHHPAVAGRPRPARRGPGRDDLPGCFPPPGHPPGRTADSRRGRRPRPDLGKHPQDPARAPEGSAGHEHRRHGRQSGGQDSLHGIAFPLRVRGVSGDHRGGTPAAPPGPRGTGDRERPGVGASTRRARVRAAWRSRRPTGPAFSRPMSGDPWTSLTTMTSAPTSTPSTAGRSAPFSPITPPVSFWSPGPRQHPGSCLPPWSWAPSPRSPCIHHWSGSSPPSRPAPGR